MRNPGQPTLCEYLITAISGLICVAFFVIVALYCSSEAKQNVQNKHNKTNTTPVLSTQTRADATPVVLDSSNVEPVPDQKECEKGGNPAFEHAIKDAKTFEESIKTKDTLPKRVWHRLTHREEASRAALILTALSILIFVAILLTKMWKEKDHYPLSMKQVVSYPQDDKKSEILVKDMLKYRARSLVSFFHMIYQRKRKQSYSVNAAQGTDQTDKCAKGKTKKHNTLDMEKFLTEGDMVFHSSKYRKIICSSSDEDSTEDNYNFKISDDKQKIELIDSKHIITNIDSDESGDDQVYAIDTTTGEWRGYQQQPNFPGENFNDISVSQGGSSSVWKSMGRKALKTSISISNKVQGRRTRSSTKRRRDLEDGSTVKLLNDYDTDDSDEDEKLNLRLVDSSTDTSTLL